MTAENRQPIVKRISVIVKLAHTGIQKTPGPGDRSETQANRPMIVRCFFRIVRLVLGLPFFSILDNGKRRPNSPPRPARILAPSTDSGRPSPRPPLSVPVVKTRARRGPPGFRLDLRLGVPLRIPPLTPCSIAPLHSPRRKSRPKHRFLAHLGPSVHSDNFPPKRARPLAIHAL